MRPAPRHTPRDRTRRVAGTVILLLALVFVLGIVTVGVTRILAHPPASATGLLSDR